MLGKIITKLYTWYYNREVKKHQKKKLTEVEKKKVEFYENMQQLYGFVTWLNTKGFTNRHARKTFWRNVVEGQSVLEDIMTDLINKYAPEKKKPRKPEGSMIKEGENKEDWSQEDITKGL